MALAAADTGFAVDKIEVRGVKQLNELKVYERVEGAIGQPMYAGQVVVAQGWFRDPSAPRNTNLSDALEFTLSP